MEADLADFLGQQISSEATLSIMCSNMDLRHLFVFVCTCIVELAPSHRRPAKRETGQARVIDQRAHVIV